MFLVPYLLGLLFSDKFKSEYHQVVFKSLLEID